MTPTRLLLAVAIAAAATVAHAAPTYSVAAPSGTYGVPTSFAAVGTAGVTSTSDYSHVNPIGNTGSAYLFTQYAGSSITLAANSSSFSFLWGSYDADNVVTFNTSAGNFSYTGSTLTSQFGIPTDGYGSLAFTATLAGGTINSVAFTSGASPFEFAVAQAVPEPETYAMLAAGLMAVGFVAKRRNKA